MLGLPLFPRLLPRILKEGLDSITKLCLIGGVIGDGVGLVFGHGAAFLLFETL